MLPAPEVAFEIFAQSAISKRPVSTVSDTLISMIGLFDARIPAMLTVCVYGADSPT